MNLTQKLAAIALVGWAGTAAAVPMDFSFTGSFTQDDDVQLFNFTADGASTVTLRSYQYAGGTMADGTIIPNGGFDSILSLFDSAGDLIVQNDDGAGVPADPNTGAAFDTLIEAILPAGDYTVAITQFDNFFNGGIGDNIALGFIQAGNPTFTAAFGCSQGFFCDVTDVVPWNNRTGDWAFDVLGVESADVGVPAPAPLALMALGFGAIGVRRRRG